MTDALPILEIRDLHVQRGGATVLCIPDLALQENEILSLIGPNGAGKSTLLLALARLIPAVGGAVFFRGQRVDGGNGMIDYRRKVAMVFQEPLLFDTTVRDNVAAGLKIRGLGRSDTRRRVGECLDLFGIAHLADRHARKLSGGEAQRTSLARALAVRPGIIFLDEPFSSLDPPTREELIDDLQRILRETQTTAVMATHDRVEALRLSDRIAVLKEGNILQIGPPAEVMNRPVDEFVASFVGMETLLIGEIGQTGPGTVIVAIADQTIEAVGSFKPGENVICCIRPEQVTITTGKAPEGTSARNTYGGTIVKIVPLGLFYRVVLDCGFPLAAYVTAPSTENLQLREGQAVYASFKATAVHVLKAGRPNPTLPDAAASGRAGSTPCK